MATTRTRTRPTTPKTRRDCRLRSQNRPRAGGGGGTSSTALMAAGSRARCLDDVARPADGVDQLGLDVVGLLAQVADVELDDVGLALEVVFPDPVEDLCLREDDPLVAHEVAKQFELGGS